MLDRDKGRWSYSVSNYGWFWLFISRHEYRSRAVPWWGMPRAWLTMTWCICRHRPWHVMGLPSAGRVLRYPIHCHRCGNRHEIVKTYENDFPPMGASHVWLDRFLKAKGH